jgi:hypothetical protein
MAAILLFQFKYRTQKVSVKWQFEYRTVWYLVGYVVLETDLNDSCFIRTMEALP